MHVIDISTEFHRSIHYAVTRITTHMNKLASERIE